MTVDVVDPDDGLVRGGEVTKVRSPSAARVHDPGRRGAVVDGRLRRQGSGGVADLLAEVVPDPAPHYIAEDEGEADQDEQRQAGGGDGDPPANRDALEEG